jgi:hypothetical protein
MKINAPLNSHDSLYHDALSLVGITDTSQYPIVQFIRNANVWYRKASIWINEAMGTWDWDDNNWTTLMATSSDLTAGTQNYNLPTGTRKINRLEVLDNNGNYQLLSQIDKSQVGVAMDEFYETDGLPKYYDLEGKNVLLYPAPAAANITTSKGLKWYIVRDISPFGITATSTEPGFDNHFHRIISMGAAYDYCLSNGIEDRKKGLRDELEQLHSEINEHYSNRNRDLRPRIRPIDNDSI